MDRTRQKVARRVTPYPDEAPSSWISRLAALEGATPDEMRRRLGVTAEVDLGFPRGSLDRLAAASGLKRSLLEPFTGNRATTGYQMSDLAPVDPLTGLRGAVCGTCLAEDEEAGRDHYMRWPWVFSWTSTCWRHGVELWDITALEALPSRSRPSRQVRVARDLDEVADPYRRRLGHRGRTRRAPATVIAFEQALGAARQGQASCAPWPLESGWPGARRIVLDLCDFLADRDTQSNLPLLTYVMEDEDRPWSWWNETRGRGGLLLRLTPRLRVTLLEAASCVLADPACFQIIELCRYGPTPFLQRFRRYRGWTSSSLSRMAVLDPLIPLLLEASERARSKLEAAASSWPAPLRSRLGAASAAALCAR